MKTFIKLLLFIISVIIIIVLIAAICGILWWNKVTGPSIEFMKNKGFKYDNQDKLSLYFVWKEIYLDNEYDNVLIVSLLIQ